MIPGKPSLFVLPFPASLTCGKEIFTLLNTVQYKSAMIQAKGQSVGSTLAAINGLAYTKRTSAQSIYSSVRIHVSTKVSHLQALTILLKILCLLWDPTVFTVMEYVLAKIYDYKELLQTVFKH